MSAVLLTGLSGAGKTTLAYQIKQMRPEAVILDGDELREGINSDLKFSDDDILENMRRTGEIVEILKKNGHNLIIISMIAPLLEGRRLLRNKYGISEYLVLQSGCSQRDVKGLYQKGTNFRQYERSDAEADKIIRIGFQTPHETACEIIDSLFLN